MAENPVTPSSKRNIWVRGLYMLLMAVLWQVSEAVLCVVAIVQFVLALVSNAPNERLMTFGRSLSRYVQQIAAFVTFASEDIPFPFSDWPSGG